MTALALGCGMIDRQSRVPTPRGGALSRTDKHALAAEVAEWPQRVLDAGVRTETRAYRPVSRNVSVLRYQDDPDGLVAEMRAILDSDGWDDPDTGSNGWNRVVEQAGPEYLWELVDHGSDVTMGRPLLRRTSLEGGRRRRAHAEAVDLTLLG
jgi:hypothetical protein